MGTSFLVNSGRIFQCFLEFLNDLLYFYMSYKKVAFLGTFKTDRPDPKPKEVSVYQMKKSKKIASAKWMHVSSLSCRDFSKNSYDYRDQHFVLSDEGITYELPPHLKAIYQKHNDFQKTEFRKIPLKPGKLRNEHKKTFRNMTESSLETLTQVTR